MKTQVTQTSIAAYHDHQHKQTQIERVARHIMAKAGEAGITLNEIAADLKMEKSTVAPRLKSLKDMQTVYIDLAEYTLEMVGKRKSLVSGVENEAWALIPKTGQIKMQLQ